MKGAVSMPDGSVAAETERPESDERLERIRRGEFDDIRSEAKRIEKTLKKRDAAKRFGELARLMTTKFSDFESAADYAAEFSEKSRRLEAAYNSRRKFETVSCISATAAELMLSALYILLFVRIGSDFKPFIFLTVCYTVMFAGFMIGYVCESEKGASACLFGAFGFAADFIMTIILALVFKTAGSVVEYLKLLVMPVVIALAAGAAVCVVWGIFAGRAENRQGQAVERKSKGL